MSAFAADDGARMSVAVTDRRIERTREALEGAFIRLIFEGRRYDRITIADLIARAGVGRSTFYEHYRNKDELLAATIRYPFAGVAAAVDASANVATLRDARCAMRCCISRAIACMRRRSSRAARGARSCTCSRR